MKINPPDKPTTKMAPNKKHPSESVEILRLGIVSQYDVIGLTEILHNLSKRLYSVKCISNQATAFFMSKAQIFLCYS